MANVIDMPRLSDTMTEGVIAAWHVKVGDKVSNGDLLAEVETDKATMDVESFFDGTVLYIGVEEGNGIPVGALLAIIGDDGENVDSIVSEFETKAAASSEPAPAEVEAAPAPVVEASAPVVVAAPAPVAVAPAPVPTAPSTNGDGRVKASPLAKAMAKDRGIDLALVSGTGDNGRIVKRDIENYVPSAAPAATAAAPAVQFATVNGVESFEEVRVSQMRKVIARRLGESKYSAPHFYLTMEINMDKVFVARKSMNEISPVKISFNDIVIKAAAMALRKHPEVNSTWLEDKIRLNHHIHVGMAVAIPDGLLVPTLKFADHKPLSHIAAESKELAGKARDRKLQPQEMEGNTFTISNLGMFGIEEFTAIINPPASCILAVGGIVDKPIVKDGQIVPGKMMKVTLSCDHRTVDGAKGSEFLVTLKSLLEDPVRLLV
ncbi:MAG: pyruvate dehydrogenase complex dihydrolipoamide acetyltransferase [Bacteroidota bacterium]